MRSLAQARLLAVCVMVGGIIASTRLGYLWPMAGFIPDVSQAAVHKASASAVKQWGVFEKELRSNNANSAAEKYRGVVLTATFTDPDGATYTVPGFWDGGGTWRVRFSPTKPGAWSYVINSSDPELDSQSNDGRFTVVAPTRDDIAMNPNYRGFLKVSPEKGYFTYADGTPFFWMGGTIWDGNSKNMAYEPDFKAYIDNRRRKKFSVIQIMAGNPGVNYGDRRYQGWNEAGPLFNHRDAERTILEKIFYRIIGRWTRHRFYYRYGEINPDSLQNFDRRIQYVVDQGMVPYIVFAWSWSFDNMPINALKSYVKYLVARYQAYNVIWCVAGEHYLSSEKWKFREIGRYLNSLDTVNHLTTIHGWTTEGATNDPIHSADFRGEPWYDFASYTAWGLPDDKYKVMLQDFYNPRTTFVLTESRYDGDEPDDRYKVVKYAWASMMAGAAGYTYGAQEIRAWNWRWNQKLRKLEGYEPGLSFTRLDLPSSFEMQYLAEFFTNRDWWKLVPNNSVVDRGKCLTELGKQYVVWLDGGGAVTVDLSQTSGELALKWLNPTTGKITVAQKIFGGSKQSFTAPFTGDAVLSIDAMM